MTPNATRTISCKAWNSPAEYLSWVARCDIKGSVSTVLNLIFSKKVQGQKHPGRWGIVKHQMPSIKVLFKTNTKGHKHPSIRLSSKSMTELVNQRKQKGGIQPKNRALPTNKILWNIDTQTWSKHPIIWLQGWLLECLLQAFWRKFTNLTMTLLSICISSSKMMCVGWSMTYSILEKMSAVHCSATICLVLR